MLSPHFTVNHPVLMRGSKGLVEPNGILPELSRRSRGLALRRPVAPLTARGSMRPDGTPVELRGSSGGLALRRPLDIPRLLFSWGQSKLNVTPV